MSSLLFKNTLNKLKDKHISEGKSYPRPTIACDDCNKDMVLCWGDKISTYIKHKSSCSNTTEESFIHKEAKRLLTQALNTKKEVKIETKCKRCANITISTIPFLIYKEEVFHIDAKDRCIFDIGGINTDNILVYGVEIFYTHKTSNTYCRRNIDWIEVKACEVIDVLLGEDENYILNNCLTLDTCNNPLCITPVPPVLYYNPVPLYYNPVPLYYNPIPYYNPVPLYYQSLAQIPQLSSESEETEEESKEEDYTNLTLEESAKILGYIRIGERYCCDAELYHHIAIKGTYSSNEIWHLEGEINSKNKEIRKYLANKRQCIKCGIQHQVTKNKLLCTKCWSSISYGRVEFEEIKVSDAKKLEIRRLFSWLYNIPGNWSKGSKCYFCELDYNNEEDNEQYKDFWSLGTEKIRSYTWWFGDKKRCCMICLQRTVNEDFPENFSILED